MFRRAKMELSDAELAALKQELEQIEAGTSSHSKPLLL